MNIWTKEDDEKLRECAEKAIQREKEFEKEQAKRCPIRPSKRDVIRKNIEKNIIELKNRIKKLEDDGIKIPEVKNLNKIPQKKRVRFFITNLESNSGFGEIKTRYGLIFKINSAFPYGIEFLKEKFIGGTTFIPNLNFFSEARYSGIRDKTPEKEEEENIKNLKAIEIKDNPEDLKRSYELDEFHCGPSIEQQQLEDFLYGIKKNDEMVRYIVESDFSIDYAIDKEFNYLDSARLLSIYKYILAKIEAKLEKE